MNKKMLFVIFLAILLIFVFVFACKGMFVLFEDDGSLDIQPIGEKDIAESNNQIYVVPTMRDEILKNSAWCASFQLVWNDIQDILVEGNIIFEEPNVLVDNLNSQIFKEKDISKEYYYKRCGLMTTELKTEIEKGILKKFNEKSGILNKLDWENRGQRYFLYAMLKRNFEFVNEFEILEKSNFKETENVEYFGIKESKNDTLREQVYVLYYENEKDFAVKLYTNSSDEIIIALKNEGINFEEIYNNIDKKTKNYKGIREFGELDVLKIPNLNINLLREYQEFAGKPFKIKNGSLVEIEKALQAIHMTLNNVGGVIKTEAQARSEKSEIIFEVGEPRTFSFDTDFVIFFKESNKDIPYFAASIEDIKLFGQK